MPLLLAVGACATHKGQLESMQRLGLHDREKAIEGLERLYRESPEDHEAYFLGELNADEERFEDMNVWFNRSLEISIRYQKRIEFRRQVLWNEHAVSGDSLFQHGDYAGAKQAYEAARAVDPLNEETGLRYLEAEVLAEGPTLQAIDRLVEAGTPGVLYRWLARETAHPSSQGTRVLKRLEREIGQSRPRTEAAFIAAELCRSRADYAGMTRWYDLSGAGSPFGTQVVDTRKALSSRLYATAIEAFRRSSYNQALTLLDSVDIVRPGLKSTAEARTAISAIAKTDGARPDATLDSLLGAGDVMNREWLSLVLAEFYTSNRLSDAARVADRILEVYPDDEPSRLARAQYRLQAGNRNGAIEDLEWMMHHGSHDAIVAYNLGVMHMENSSYQTADEYFRAADEWGMDRDLTLRQRVFLSFYRKDFETMKRLVIKLTDRHPGDSEAWRLLQIAAQMIGDGALEERCRDRLKELE